MDLKELQGLMEAYSEVYAPQEVDEAVKGESSERRSDLAAERRAGLRPKSAKEGERYASHKLSQMAYVKRQRMGEEVEEVGEEMKPLPKKKMERQAERAYRKEVRAVAAGDEKETNKQMQRRIAMQDPRSRRTALQNKKMAEELDIFDAVLEFLQVEGYVETLEEAEWLMANVIDEEAIGIILGEEQLDELSNRTVSNALNARIAATGAASDRAYKHRNPEAMRAAETAAGKEASMKSAVAKRRARMNNEEYMDEADSIAAMRERAAKRRKQRYGSEKFGRDDFKSNADKAKEREANFKKFVNKEEYVDEAQVANRDPDKYEREQSKKSAPVRGEKTPMPPRGDKRREDFEKWYAANVR